MPITVKWSDTEFPVLEYTVSDPWSWSDFYAATEQGRALREAVGLTQVDVIFELAQSRQLPQGSLSQLSNIMRRGPGAQHANHIMLVNASPFIRSISEIVIRLSARKDRQIAFTSSIAEAHQRLRALAQRQTEAPEGAE